MNDLIMRKDVEQMLKDLGGCDANDKEAAGWDKAIDAAMEGLRKIESADRWIPCSERFLKQRIMNSTDYTVTARQLEPEPWKGKNND